MKNSSTEIKNAKALKLNEYEKKFKMDLSGWMRYHHSEIVMKNCTYRGIKTFKNPLDMWIYQEIVNEIKPDIIIEIGSMYGGSTLFFADLLESIGKGNVISIDIQRHYYKAKHSRIIELTGDSASQEIVKQVYSICKDKSVLIIHDGEHSKVQVLKDIKAYADLVSLNSYFIVEDTANEFMSNNPLYEGPFEAVEEFLKNNTDFIVDNTRERYILTYSMNGFLKRIKTGVRKNDDTITAKDNFTVHKNDIEPYLVAQNKMIMLSNYVKANAGNLDYECEETMYKVGLNLYNLFKDTIRFYAGRLNLKGNTAVYGTGDFCEVLIAVLKDFAGIELKAVVEKNETMWGNSYLGLPVISIDELQDYKINNIVIASLSHGKEIYHRLQNIKNVNIFKFPHERLEIPKITDQLLNAYPINSQIMMGKPQLYVILAKLEEILQQDIEGEIVELGCNAGSTSLFIRRMLNIYKSPKQFHVYDSFEGLPEHTENDIGKIQRYKGECKTTRETFIRNFREANLLCPVINEGWFKEIPDEKYPAKIAFAFFDGDFYTSIIDSFNKVYHKLTKNAVVCFHDYSNENLPGVKKACDDFLKDKPEKVFELNGIGYMVKH